MIPVYVFYSMFGWQRTGDEMWALGDQLGRGFLLGATAGRTTLTGEGLQHNDGHSLLLASVSPACVAYDAAWAYELGYIVKDGLRRMYGLDRGPPGRRGHLLLPDRLQRALRPARRARRLPGRQRGAGAGRAARAVPLRARAGAASAGGDGPGPTGPAQGAGRDQRRPGGRRRDGRGPRSWRPGWRCAGPWRRSGCSPRTGASRPTSGRRPPGRSCAARRCAARNGTCCSRRRSTRCLTWPRCWTGHPARWSRSATGSAPFPTRSPAGCPAPFSSLGTDG